MGHLLNQKGNTTSNAYTIYKATFNPFAIITLTIDLLIRQCHEILNFILFGQKTVPGLWQGNILSSLKQKSSRNRFGIYA